MSFLKRTTIFSLFLVTLGFLLGRAPAFAECKSMPAAGLEKSCCAPAAAPCHCKPIPGRAASGVVSFNFDGGACPCIGSPVKESAPLRAQALPDAPVADLSEFKVGHYALGPPARLFVSTVPSLLSSDLTQSSPRAPPFQG